MTSTLVAGRLPRRLVQGAAVATLATVALAGCATTSAGSDPGETITIRYASHVGPGNANFAEATWWMDAVTERVAAETDYEVDFNVYANGSLLGGGELLSGLKDGRADMAMVVPFSYPSEFPYQQLATIPFLSESVSGSQAAWDDLAANDERVKAEWEAQGVIPLFFGAAANVTSGTADPITSLGDLDGSQMSGIGYTAQALESLGATVRSMSVGDVYEGLERGVVDGFSTSPFTGAILNSRFHEVAPNFIDLRVGQYVAAVDVAVSQTFWDTLPEEVREIMRETADELLTEGISLEIAVEKEREACDELRAADGTIFTVSDSELEQWKSDVFDELVSTWSATTPDQDEASDLLDKYTDLVEQHDAEYESASGIQGCSVE